MTQKLLLTLSIMLILSSLSAQKTITGVVTDAETGDPIPGVKQSQHLLNKLKDYYIKSKYTIEVSDTIYTLVFSFCSAPQEYTVDENTKVLDVILGEQLLGCNYVTTIGISIDEKKKCFSETTFSDKDISENKPINISEALKARVAGVQVSTASGSPGASSRIIIRGLKSLSKSNQPLIIVDGVPTNNP